MKDTQLRKLIIIGASGQGKVVADIARLNGYNDIAFLDNNVELKECCGYPVLGADTLVDKLEGELFVAVGKNVVRKIIMEREKKKVFPVLIHPSATLAEGVEVGSGSVVMAGAVINPGARLGEGCIVNTCASIDHDCIIGDFVHVSVGAHLAGSVNVGAHTWIGAGAIISNNISICEDCIIGAGAVVVKDIDISGTYIGVPAKIKG